MVGACVVGGCMAGGGACVVWGACMVGGMYDRGMHGRAGEWQEGHVWQVGGGGWGACMTGGHV